MNSKEVSAKEVANFVLHEITLQRIFDGDAEARMAELELLMLFLLRNRGLQHILMALTRVLEKRSAYHGELQTIGDLKSVLKNYMTRYDEDKQKASETLLSSAREDLSANEIERELHQFVLDSMHVVSMKLEKGDPTEVDANNVEGEIARLIVEKIMDRFFGSLLVADREKVKR